ncbi:hypothetical protein CY34DRAFT_12037 [Suillus luteus UH-Slu-Lm8-n1]|uniref:Uncharacterized protein n=1 Tax=Suillus luteus UH-Slu-Lm8-n1 TaxID=930992 RepID=A0A0C9ZZI5_9AGAM|nr:hypothetical protein CY34DRAFT_12037 [Suillus luteus UH-Slu-Lm8-n1]
MGPQFADRITVNKARQVAAETSRVMRGAQGREREVTVVYESGRPSKVWVALARALGFRLQDNSSNQTHANANNDTPNRSTASAVPNVPTVSRDARN